MGHATGGPAHKLRTVTMPIDTAKYHTSLLTAIDCRSHVHLVVGTNPLAAARCTQSLGAGAVPILIAPEGAELHYSLQKRIEDGEVQWLRRPFTDDDLFTLGRDEVSGVVDAVFVTSGARGGGDAQAVAAHVSALCRRHRIPVNVVDAPALCSFSLLSTHTDGPLQVGVTTNGRGCKLASRVRREVAAALPAGLGAACARLGEARRRVLEEEKEEEQQQQQQQQQQQHQEQQDRAAAAALDEGVDDSYDQRDSFNRLVVGAAAAAKGRRMRWLAQVCEYWPLKRLAALTSEDVEAVLRSHPPGGEAAKLPTAPGRGGDEHGNPDGLGRIILAGAGPGHPDLLTRSTHRAILSADLVLADKLVPQGVLDLIPRRAQVTIARKFPGNADAAQDELLAAALTAVRAGKVVLRLKQGDPFLYGRGGEEVAYFRARGLGARVVVLPGVTSALSAPLFAGIPATQRDVADQVLICTGTGKKGRAPAPPGYNPSRTAVFLMALHRISALVAELTKYLEGERDGEKEDEGWEDERVVVSTEERRHLRRLWPRDTPCAVVERASCPDQKVIRTTLDRVVEAVEHEGSRPPGLLVVGKACEALFSLEKGRSWVVQDGFKGLDLDDIVPHGIAAMA